MVNWRVEDGEARLFTPTLTMAILPDSTYRLNEVALAVPLPRLIDHPERPVVFGHDQGRGRAHASWNQRGMFWALAGDGNPDGLIATVFTLIEHIDNLP